MNLLTLQQQLHSRHHPRLRRQPVNNPSRSPILRHRLLRPRQPRRYHAQQRNGTKAALLGQSLRLPLRPSLGQLRRAPTLKHLVRHPNSLALIFIRPPASPRKGLPPLTAHQRPQRHRHRIPHSSLRLNQQLRRQPLSHRPRRQRPALNPALHTKCNIYLIHLDTFTQPSARITQIPTPNLHGALTSPSFSVPRAPSRDGPGIESKLAFLAMQQDGYEADRNRLCIVPDLRRPAYVTVHDLGGTHGGTWDRSPDSVHWSLDGGLVYLTADDAGTKRLFWTTSDPTTATVPQTLKTLGSVADLSVLDEDNIYVSSTSYVDGSTFSIYEPRLPRGDEPRLLDSLTDSGAKLGLSREQETEFYYTSPSPSTSAGADAHQSRSIHARVIRPPGFNGQSRYPVALLVHGGPQSAWSDAWSTRWNPHVFAAAGYVVVMPNITGSTGYGQAFTDAIRQNWGGAPYEDLVALMDFLDDSVPYADTSRAVALGASYGGYMMNWMQGHALGRRFKALVCHDGVFSTRFEQASDELYFIHHDFGGSWNDPAAREQWDNWDPSLHTQNWETPQLVVHSENDYRLSMADGVAAFNALQEKGVESRFLTFGDENHFVTKAENSLVWHEVVLGWCGEYVGLLEKGGGREGIARADAMRTTAEDMARVSVAE